MNHFPQDEKKKFARFSYLQSKSLFCIFSIIDCQSASFDADVKDNFNTIMINRVQNISIHYVQHLKHMKTLA